MQVYFMRHGQTNFNRLALCNDNPNQNVHLTEVGKRQAQAVAEELKSIPIQRIITSPLPRTIETANIINQYHEAPTECHAGINDIRSGFDGLPVADYQKAIADDPLHMKANGGESLLEHKARVIEFLDWLKTQPESNLLVVAHEETLRVVAGYLRALDDNSMCQLCFDNCEYLSFTL